MASPAPAATEPGVRSVLDASRRRDADRPWYRYAARLLPQTAAGPWLDFGCGQGEFLELAAARGLPGIGIDLARSNAIATARAGRPALVADLTRPLPLRTASLAGATLIEVIEHIVNAEALVAELARVIRPGGWLVATTPNVAHLTYRWRALTGHPPKQEGRHYRFFTASTFARLFRNAGFEPREHASFGKQALLSSLLRLAGRGQKVRYPVAPAFEPLLAQHLVWRLERI
jgi:SAM-dependent methyltransferase